MTMTPFGLAPSKKEVTTPDPALDRLDQTGRPDDDSQTPEAG